MKNVLIDENTLKEIADTIRNITNSVSKMLMKNVPSKIEEIANTKYQEGYTSGVGATKKGTASASDVLTGKTFTNASSVDLSGSMPNLQGTNISNGTTTVDKVLSVGNFDVLDGSQGAHEYGDVTIRLPSRGCVNTETTLTQRIFGLNPSVVRAGKRIGSYGSAGASEDSYIDGTFTADATASADMILEGETAYVNGEEVVGTMPNKGALSSTVNCGGAFTIPKGYHNGNGRVTGKPLADQTQATAISSEILGGKTAYVNGVKLSGTMQNRGAVTRTIIPSTETQEYTIPEGYHNGTGKVTVSGAPTSLIDGDAIASEVLSGKKFFVDSYTAKTGSMPNNGTVTKALNCGESYTIPKGYHSGSGKVSANSLASQTEADAVASNLLSGKTAYVTGSKITGSMTNRGAVSSALNCGGSYTIPKGYHDGSGKVTANSLASQTEATASASDIVEGKTAYVNGKKLTGTNTSTSSEAKLAKIAEIESKLFPICRDWVKVLDNTFYKLNYIGKLWFAYSNSSVGVYCSEDGKHWNKATIQGSMTSFDEIKYGNGVYIGHSSGYNDTDGIYYSTNGIDWYSCSVHGSSSIGRVEYKGGIWVGASIYSEIYHYFSTDGKTWYQSNLIGKSKFLYYIDNFCLWLSGVDGRGLYYSNDGKTWYLSDIPSSISFSNIFFINGRLFAPDRGTNIMYRSTDGKYWSSGTIPLSGALYYGTEIQDAIVFNSKIFLSFYQGVIYSSDGGANWNYVTQFTSGTYRFAKIGSYLVARGSGGAISGRSIYYSQSGLTWTQCSTADAPNNYYTDMSEFNGKYFSYSNANHTMYSTDGITWKSVVDGNSGKSVGRVVGYINGVYISDGHYYSTDGINWTSGGLEITNMDYSRYLRLGKGILISTSNDGVYYSIYSIIEMAS